jgi:hypothetical protein
MKHELVIAGADGERAELVDATRWLDDEGLHRASVEQHVHAARTVERRQLDLAGRMAVKAARARAHADLLSYFNLVLQLRLNAEEKKDIVAFLRTL